MSADKRDWKEEITTRAKDVTLEVITCLKSMLNPKNVWIYLAVALSVTSIYVARADNINWFLEKGPQENLALILISSAAFFMLIASIISKQLAPAFVCVLAVNFFIRELDQTPITIAGATFALRTKVYIYVALAIMAAWGFWQEKKIIPFFNKYTLLRTMMLGVITTYFVSQLIARRVFKHIPILPHEHEIHIPLEEVTENYGHLFFLVMSLFFVAYSLRGKRGSTPERDTENDA